MRFRSNKYLSNSLVYSLCIFWIFAIVIPILKLFTTISIKDFTSIIQSSKFSIALLNSITVSTVATLISLLLAGLFAWCVARSKVKHKTLINTFLTAPMLIPSISHGMGLIIILGSNGWLTKLLNLESGIYGFWGIVIGSIMYSFPVAYIMLYDVLRYEDGTPYEVAYVLGFSNKAKFMAITLPYMRKPLISVFFATFTMIITDYGVPLMIGGKFLTLPVMMYQDVIGMLEFGKGSVIGIVLLIPALIASILDISGSERGYTSFVTKAIEVKTNNKRDCFSYIVITIMTIIILIPIASFVILSFVNNFPIDISFSLNHLNQAIRMGAAKYLVNSLIISTVVAIAGSIIAVLNAYVTARSNNRWAYILHLFAISSLAIPGIVLGLSYVLNFNESFLYGTMFILFLVNIIHFFASPYLMIYNSFRKINSNLEAVGATIGISRWKILKDVILPQSKSTICEMVGYFFVNSMMTISAVSFLARVSNKPIALMITQFEAQMQLECAAIVSFVILIINVLMKFLIFILKLNIMKVTRFQEDYNEKTI